MLVNLHLAIRLQKWLVVLHTENRRTHKLLVNLYKTVGGLLPLPWENCDTTWGFFFPFYCLAFGLFGFSAGQGGPGVIPSHFCPICLNGGGGIMLHALGTHEF